MDTYLEPEETVEESKFYFPTQFTTEILNNPKSMAMIGGAGLGLIWLLIPKLRPVTLLGAIALVIWFINRQKKIGG